LEVCEEFLKIFKDFWKFVKSFGNFLTLLKIFKVFKIFEVFLKIFRKFLKTIEQKSKISEAWREVTFRPPRARDSPVPVVKEKSFYQSTGDFLLFRTV